MTNNGKGWLVFFGVWATVTILLVVGARTNNTLLDSTVGNYMAAAVLGALVAGLVASLATGVMNANDDFRGRK